jgi:hypothetical protein
MPLRDHFHPPLSDHHNWEAFHSAWANTIVRHLNQRLLPARYRAAPQVHLGAQVEVDVATFEEQEEEGAAAPTSGSGDGVATAVWAPPRPTQAFIVSFPAQDAFEVRVFDDRRGSRLVAAVEFVSPRNKDRPAARRAFAVKCASYLQQQVSVVLVDVVTDRRDDLYAHLLDLLQVESVPSWAHDPPLYAVACRTAKSEDQWRLEAWPGPLTLGAPLPTLPLWLASNLAVPLELEPSYEETCRVLRIG